MEKKLGLQDKLVTLYSQAEGLNEALPAELLQKLKLYGEIFSISGKLHAAAVGEWKLAESLRKECIATVFTLDPEGTVKDREMKAEYAASEHRRNEAKAEANCMRWKNAMEANREIIQILKLQYRDLIELQSGRVKI